MFDISDLTPLDETEKRRFSMRHFIVTGDKPKIPGSIARHLRFSVVCADIKRAIELAEQAHPDCKIHTVSDQGAVDKVDNG